MLSRRWATVWLLIKSKKFRELSKRILRLVTNSISKKTVVNYTKWRKKWLELSEEEKKRIKETIKNLTDSPSFSLVLDAKRANPVSLFSTIESVMGQLYTNYFLYITDSNSLDSELEKKILSLNDSRVKLVDSDLPELNEWIIELEAGTRLHDAALFVLSTSINKNPDIQIIYSDHDHVDSHGRFRDPHMKPDWNADLFAAMNYMKPLAACSKELWLSHRNKSSVQHRFLIEATRNLSNEEIFHIPNVLASVEITDDYSHLKPSCERIFRDVPSPAPKVSILVPSRDQGHMIERCLKSLFDKTDYPNYEVVLIDHETTESKALRIIEEFKIKDNFQVVDFSGSFNFSAMINNAVKVAQGQVLLLLNNDTEVIDSGWLTEIVSQVSRPEVGAVGALLVFSDNTIQHAGVHPDPEGFMTHGHKHWPRESSGYFSRLLAVHEVAAVTGACLAIRRDSWDLLGGLDEENLPVAYNDIDLCLKARKEGLKIIFTPYACLMHHESISRGIDVAPEKNLRLQNELIVMRARWGGMLSVDPAYNPNLSFDRGGFNFRGNRNETINF